MRRQIPLVAAAIVLLAGCAAPVNVTLTPTPIEPSGDASLAPMSAPAPVSAGKNTEARTYVGKLSSPAASGDNHAITWECSDGMCTLSLDPVLGTVITFVDVGDGAYSLTSPPVGDPCGPAEGFVPGLTGQLTVDTERLVLNATTESMRVTCDGTGIKSWPSFTIAFDGAREE